MALRFCRSLRFLVSIKYFFDCYLVLLIWNILKNWILRPLLQLFLFSFAARSRASIIKTFNSSKNLVWLRVLNTPLSKKIFILNDVDCSPSAFNRGKTWWTSAFLIFDFFFSSPIVFFQCKISFYPVLRAHAPCACIKSNHFEKSSRKLLIVEMCLEINV